MQEIAPGFHLEADVRGKNASVVISGVKGVKEFSGSSVVLATKRECVRIDGEGLAISVFEYGSIGISGKISGILFYERKRGKVL